MRSDHPVGAKRDLAYLRVETGESDRLLIAPIGATLRDVLLANDCSPYTALTERLNCGGRGLCATCGVRFAPGRIEVGGSPPRPEHWHDALASRFGYPRLSCQVEVDRDLHVSIPEKLVWGGRRTEEP
jgi:ferredoxin